ncbi:cytochrome bc1 complex diheme cytochrome c subunit [Nocardioides dongkuii]
MVLLLLGLVITGGLTYAVMPTSQADSAQTNAVEVEEGRKLFLQGCSFCHGQNGEGVRTINGDNLGPSVVGAGAASVHFQVGTGRMPMTRPGVQSQTKPQVYNEEEIRQLAAYVASLAPGPAIPEEQDYTFEGLDEEEREAAIARGGQIFLTNCTACHNFAGKGGAMPRGGYAPSLDGTSAIHIYEAMLTGPGQMDTFSNGNLSPDDKRDVIGYLYSLREQPAYGGFTLGSLGPVTEGLFAWLVGIGGLVAFAVWIAAHTTRTSKKKKVEA